MVPLEQSIRDEEGIDRNRIKEETISEHFTHHESHGRKVCSGKEWYLVRLRGEGGGGENACVICKQ